MTRILSQLISWGCVAVLVLAPAAFVYLLWNIELFARLAQSGIDLPVSWQSVTNWQWYTLWLITLLYLGIGWSGIFYLRCAFTKFASGELINLVNSRNIRRFSVLLFMQAIAKPLLLTISSVLLSANHPKGQKMLSISLGSNEIWGIALALVFWVVSSLMFEANRIQSENEKFI
jgi:hypothetical protein